MTTTIKPYDRSDVGQTREALKTALFGATGNCEATPDQIATSINAMTDLLSDCVCNLAANLPDNQELFALDVVSMIVNAIRDNVFRAFPEAQRHFSEDVKRRAAGR